MPDKRGSAAEMLFESNFTGQGRRLQLPAVATGAPPCRRAVRPPRDPPPVAIFLALASGPAGCAARLRPRPGPPVGRGGPDSGQGRRLRAGSSERQEAVGSAGGGGQRRVAGGSGQRRRRRAGSP